jgi:hypothetical protein
MAPIINSEDNGREIAVELKWYNLNGNSSNNIDEITALIEIHLLIDDLFEFLPKV